MDERHLRIRKTSKQTTITMMHTELGKTIIRILIETESIASVVEYLRDNELFLNCEPIDQYKYAYLYKIGLDQWIKATGIDTLPNRYSTELSEDGRLWIEYENDGTQYVYIALDNYTGQFDNDECFMAPVVERTLSIVD